MKAIYFCVSLLGNVEGSWEAGLQLPPEFSDRITIAVEQVTSMAGVCRTQPSAMGKPQRTSLPGCARHSDHLDFKISVISSELRL